MNIFERGYNRWLTREAPSENLESKNAFEEGVSPNMLLSGGLSGNLEMVDGHIQSANFVEDTTGWQIKHDGTAQFSDITLIGGGLRYEKADFSDDTHSGYYIGPAGIYMGSVDDATKLKFTIADGSLDLIGTVSGRSTATLAGAINSGGNLSTDVINTKLDTSAKQILDGFTFGASGAIQIGTYSAGVSGDIKISSSGIVGRNKSNENTFTLDATTGNATFAGELSAATGTLGTITSATITAGSFQTASTGARVTINASDNHIRIYDSDGNHTGAIGSSLDATSRYLDLGSPDDIDIPEIARIVATKDDGTGFLLRTASKGYQVNRFSNENTDAYRTNNNTAILEIFQLGTGTGISITDNSDDSTGIPLNIGAPNKSNNTNPSIKINRSAGGPHFRLEGDPTGFTPTDGDIWFDGTDLFIRVGSKTFKFDKTEV